MISPTKTIWPSQRKLSAAYAVAIALLVAIVLFTVNSLLKITSDTKQVNRSHDVGRAIGEIRSRLLNAEVAQMAYLATGRNELLEEYGRSLMKVQGTIDWVMQRLYGVETRREHMRSVEAAVASMIDQMDQAILAHENGGSPEARVGGAGKLRKRVDREIAAMDDDETLLRNRLREELNDLFWSSIYAFSAASVLDLILLLGVNHLNNRSRRELTLNSEWFATTLRSIGDAVIATDAAGRINLMNGVAEELTGWKEAEAFEVPLERVFRIIDTVKREPVINPVGRVLASGEIQGMVDQHVLIARDGTERPIDDCASPIKPRGGIIRGVVLVFRDVTRDKAARAERERLYQELSERDKRKDEFLAMLAHELRNPLAAIGNAVMISSRQDMREHLEWSLGVIRRQMRHLSRLIDDLLDVSRISRGKIDLQTGRIDVSTILENAVESVRPLIDERHHSLRFSVQPGGIWAEADPTRLEQVVVNLLNNAAKYTEPGGTIKLEGFLEANSVVIRVSDTGVGIPPEKLPEMFELFAQGDRSLARSEGGLGIGLTLVKKLVEMHRGTITAESGGEGKGCAFTIRIPAASPVAGVEASPPKGGQGSETSRVLVVDDNVDTVLGLSKILTTQGHQVAAAYSGPEALEAARANRPEFILLDIGLPGMDGYEVAKRLRQEESGREAILIAMTGYGLDADRRRAKESGFDHHLVKPLDHDVLVSLLAKH